MTILEFLEARIAEDEQSAQWTAQPEGEDYDEATFGESRWKGRKADWTEVWNGAVDTGDDIQHIGDDTISSFMVDYDPARALREVAAKRAIIEAAYDIAHLSGDLDGDYHTGFLKLLAAVYSDHPDYQADWG